MNALAQKTETELAPQREAPGTVRTYDDPVISMIERVVLDPNIPIDRLERVLAMKERMEDRAREDDDRKSKQAAKEAYFAAFSTCQEELPVVTKNQNNTHTKSRYADLAAIEEQAMPVIYRHGFGVSFQPDGYNAEGELRLLWQITHKGGHSREGIGEIPVDNAGSQGKVNKTGTQAFGSTATYGRRYLLCMLFNISTGDDNDGNTGTVTEYLDEDQIEELKALIDQAVELRDDTTHAAWMEYFLEFMKVPSLNAIPAKDYGKAKTMIQSAIAKWSK